MYQKESLKNIEEKSFLELRAFENAIKEENI
jgi:hypothetical protein